MPANAPTGKKPLPLKYTVMLFCAAMVYLWARPHLEKRFGIELPGPRNEAVADNDQAQQPDLDLRNTETAPQAELRDIEERGSGGGNVADRTSGKKNSLPRLATPPPLDARGNPNREPAASKTGGGWELKTVGRDRFESPGGLVYRPGPGGEHRLEHVMRHAEDQPNRSGSHGVFNGDRDAILKLLDDAYRMGQKGGRGVKVERQDRRTVYTVDMGRKIGYIGGQTGKRKRNPAVRHVRLVIQGNEVITAYPLKPY